MNKWTKALSLFAAAAMALSLSACGSSDASSAAASSAASETAAAETAAAETAAAETAAAETAAAEASGADAAVSGDVVIPDTDDIKAIQERGVLHVGVKNAVQGFGFQDTLTGEYSGMEIDLATKLAEDLGVDVEFTTVTAATRTELLDSGDIDCVLATFTITDERKKSWDFTTPYYTDHVTVLVEDSSGITSLADLVGKTIGVSSGSTSAKSVVEAMIDAGLVSGDNYDAETFDPATWTEGVSFKQYDDYPTISTALSAGEVDAFSVDKSILAIYHTDGRSYIEEEFAPQEYGVATTKGSGMSEFCEAEITKWLSDGTIDGLIANYGLG